MAVDQLRSGYGRKRVIFDASLRVEPAEVVSIVGHNGAGKTTLLKTIFGMLPAQGGRVLYDGIDICGENCRRAVRRGISFIPAERSVFGELTVTENLMLGAPVGIARGEARARLGRVHGLFPMLEGRPTQLAGTLSGGQQRMLSIGIALMRAPRMLLLDEPSLGLAPAVVERLFDAVRSLALDEGRAVILVEQNLRQAFAISDRVYVMRAGRIALEAPADELRGREHYWDLF